MISSEFSLHQNEKNISRDYFVSPIGLLKIELSSGKVISISQVKKKLKSRVLRSDGRVLEAAKAQLRAYFLKKRKQFDLPLQTQGTQFQNLVWAAMSKIPFGQTLSYGELAAKIGRPKAARAIGNACNSNPHLIVMPCHRVIAATGVGGFAIGAKKKQQLLNHETP